MKPIKKMLKCISLSVVCSACVVGTVQAAEKSVAKSAKGKKPVEIPSRCRNVDSKIIKVKATADRIRHIDGDTFAYQFKDSDCVFDRNGRPFKGSLRLLAFDTPEKFAPGIGMFYNQTCAEKASAKIKSELNAAKKIEIWVRTGRSTRGRILAHVFYQDRRGTNKLLAAEMLKSGLAYETVSAFGNNGFVDLRPMIDQAWEQSPLKKAMDRGRAPAFMSPYIWRRMNLQYRHRITRWRYMSEEEREDWLRHDYPGEIRNALDRAVGTRADMIEKAEDNPGTRRSRETLFHLTKFPRDQRERRCRL